MNIDDLQGAIILAIDDNPTNLTVLSEYFTEVGLKVLLKKDGKSGIAVATKRQPDLILLDIMMPGLDGYETCRRLKASDATKDIPVIFMSALSETIDKIRGFEVGGVDYVTKPLQHQEVLARVIAHLRIRHLQKRLEEQNTQLQQEIAEHTKTEQALRRLQIAVETTEVGITITDQKGQIVYTNPADAKMHGYTVEQLIGQNSSIFSPDVHEEKEKSEDYCKDIPNWKRKRNNLRKDGTIFPVELISNPICDEQGNYLGRVTVCDDITERKQAEEALHHQREMAESLREVATILNSSLDLETVLTMILEQMQRVIYHDAAGIFLCEGDDLVLIAGFLREGIDKTNLGRHISLKSESPAARVFRQQDVLVLADVRNEPDWLNWPGTSKIKSWMAAPMVVGQHTIGVLTADLFTANGYADEDKHLLQAFANQAAIAIHNARVFHESQQAKNHAEEAKRLAEAANQAKSTFLANMSHELRTPLNAILGFTQIMAQDPHTSEEQENLAIIQRSGEHLLTLINQVLDLSKVEAGHISLDETNFDLHRMLEDLEDMFRLRAEKKGLQLLFEWGDDIPHSIRTDEVKLRQVLMNLLSNAIKFTEQGEVRLKIERLWPVQGQVKKLNIENKAGEGNGQSSMFNLQFSISDTGPGIAPEEIDRLFEAFAQTEAGRQTQEGTGLGLAISRRFVQLMGGDITVSSDIGQGTTFAFTIHCEQDETVTLPQSSMFNRVLALAPGQPRYRLLIVDDNPDNRLLLVKLLSNVSSPRSGFEIQEAANGQEAFDIWQHWAPHLIWMDLRMPGLDGYDATKRIREEEQKARRAEGKKSRQTKSNDQQSTIIIAVTASSFEEEQMLARSIGADDFLRKPFQRTEVFEVLHKHLGVEFVCEDQGKGSKVEDERRVGAQSTVPVLTPETLAGLPEGLLANFRDAIEAIDIETTNHLITELRRHNDALADVFLELVNEYRFDRLQELFEKIP